MSAPISVLYFGTPDFAVPALKSLLAHPEQFVVRGVVTQPDRPAGRGGKLRCSPVKEIAAAHNIPILQPSSIKKEWKSFSEAVSALGPIEIGVVAAFGQILPQSLLDMPKHGFINIHGSLLPRWRGAAPIHRAILAGDKKTGVGLMQMEAGLDTGAVFSEREIPLTENSTTGEVHDLLASVGAELLVQDLRKIITGDLKARAQREEGVTYAKKIESAEAHLDSWNIPAQELSRKIRAFSPFPGAFCFVGGKRFKILKASALSLPTNLVPGELRVTDSKELLIGCQNGAIRVEEAQLEGRSRMPIEELLKGFRPAPGEKIG